MDQSIRVVGKIIGKLLFKMKNIKYAQKKFTFNKGKMIGDFEGYYRNFENPFLQTEKEKFETSKKAIINYCQMLKSKSKRKKKLKVIEIGCGFGILTKQLSTLGFEAYGTDISPTAIKKAIKKSNCKFYVSDFINDKLYLKINPDIIILSEITWYILPELKKFLQFIKNFRQVFNSHTCYLSS